MKNLFLILIITLSLAIRVYKLESYPYGINADEAALAYNSYSLITTGKDEHGHPWPINLESFGDFKPAGYAYILIPFIKIFGLNDFIIRLPSALFGVLGVLGIYLLTKSIFENKNIALISALVAATNPWLIHFSRGAWEVNVSTTLIIFAIYSSLQWYKSKKLTYLITSVILFVSSMYVYQSARVLAPLLVVSLLIIFRKDLFQQKIKLLISIFLGILVILPLLVSVVTSDAASRFTGVGFLSDEGPLNRVKEIRGHYEEVNIVNRIMHNRPVIYGIEFIHNYLDHFDLDFLFLNGDKIERSKIPETGQFHIIDILFLIFGLISIFRLRNNKKIATLISWLLIAPIPAALTFQTPHALRSHSMAIPLIILISYGIWTVLSYFNSKIIKNTFAILILVVYIWSFGRYVNQYLFQYPYKYPSAWQAEFKQLVEKVSTLESKYSKVIVTDKYDQPYILFLYYSKYNPQSFQSDHILTFRDKFNFSTVRKYSKFEFKNIDSTVIRESSNSLIIAHPSDIGSDSVNIIDKIYYSNGKVAFILIEK